MSSLCRSSRLHASQQSLGLSATRAQRGHPRRARAQPCQAVAAEHASSSSSSSNGSTPVTGGGGALVAVQDEPHSLAIVPDAPHALVVQPGKRIAVLSASKQAAHPVAEKGRPLEAYMTLPASQYSLLDAHRVERIDDSTFRCYVGGLQFLSLHVEPVITVQASAGVKHGRGDGDGRGGAGVTVEERGPTVKLLSTKLQGSKVVEAANDRFTATMTNVVRWREAEAGGGKEIVTLEVPRWFLLPVAAIERTGCAVMARVLDSAVPRFLAQLAADYELWAAGEHGQREEATGSLLDLREVNREAELEAELEAEQLPGA
eukprot:scaffold13.g316.t1